MSDSSPSPGDRVLIRADATRCVGAGQCVLTDPTTFDQSDEGTVHLLRTTADRKVITEVITRCPSGAISLA